MSMHRLRFPDSSDCDNVMPRVYGDVKCNGVSLNKRQRVRVEHEVLDWICSRKTWRDKEELQYWVSFDRHLDEPIVSCRVGIVSDAGLWEDSEYSSEPFKAFRKCLECLAPVVVREIA